MADLEKTISIIFKGEDRLSQTMTGITKNFKTFDLAIQGAAKPLAELADGVLAADAALAALTVGGLVYATAKSIEFESATVNLSKILGEEKDKIGIATEAALELSNQYGRSASSVLESATDFKRAGFEIKDSLTLTEEAIGLVIGAAEAELGVAEATEIIIATLKGFKAPASEAARLTDILNTVSNEYATNVTELGIGMSKLSPIAHKMGFSFEETAGILTPVIEIFRSGDEASTALRTGLLKLVDDAKPVQEGLAKLGISQRDANGQLRSGKDILNDVAKAFETAEKDEKLFLASQLVGIRQAAKMVEVFDGLRYSTEITGRALEATGSIAREVAAKLATGEIAVNRFKVGFENLGIVVGDQFLEASKKAIDGGTAIEKALQTAVQEGTFEPLFNALSNFGDKLGAYLKGVAEAVPEAFADVDFDKLLGALGELGGEIGEFFDGLDLRKPEDLTKAIQFAVDSVESLVRVTAGMAEAFQPIWDAIINTITAFNELDNSGQKSTGSILGAAKIIVEAGTLMAAALVTVGQSAEVIERIFKTVGGGIGVLWNSFQVTFDLLAGAVIGAVQLMNEGLAKVTWGDTAKQFEANAKWAADLLDAIGEDMVAQAEDYTESSNRMWEGVAGKAKEATSEVEDFGGAIQVIDGVKVVELSAVPDIESISKADDLIKTVAPAEKVTSIKPVVDTGAVSKAKEVLDDKLLKKLKIEADIDLARIKAQAEIAQSSLEWKAKIDIAEIEAGAKKIEALADSLSKGFESTGETITSLFGLLTGEGVGFSEKWAIEDQISAETKLREKQFLLQKQLTEAEIKMMKEKTKRLQKGDALIKIDGAGLAPHLEMILWEILEAIQVRASAEYAEFLLGL